METTAAITVIERLARRLGKDPAHLDAAVEWPFLLDLLSERLENLWTSNWWSELVTIEERDLAVDAAGAVYLPWEASGQQSIRDTRCIYDRDPRLDASARQFWPQELPPHSAGLLYYAVGGVLWNASDTFAVGQIVYHSGVFYEVTAEATNQEPPDTDYYSVATTPTLWVEYRRPAPRFTGTDWSAATAYTTGDVAYASGNFYTALQDGTNKPPATEPTYWSLLTIPTPFVRALSAAEDHYAQARSEIAWTRLPTTLQFKR